MRRSEPTWQSNDIAINALTSFHKRSIEQCDLNHGEIGFAIDFWVMLSQQDVTNAVLCSGGFAAVKPPRLETYGNVFRSLQQTEICEPEIIAFLDIYMCLEDFMFRNT